MKYFIGFEGYSNGGWYIERTNNYKLNNFGEYVTTKGTYDKYFDTLEDAQSGINVRDKGYVRFINT